jgi:hypothetical protein
VIKSGVPYYCGMIEIPSVRSLSIGLVAAVTAALAWVFLASEAPQPSIPSQHASTAPAQPPQAAHQAPTPSVDNPKPTPPDNNLASIRIEIRDTKNLRASIDKLRALPDPTGDISYMLARAVADCFAFSGPGLDYMKKSAQAQPNLVHRLQRLQLIEARSARCTSFGMGTDSANLMAELDDQAAKSNHPGALSRKVYHSLFHEGTDQGDAYVLPLLERSADMNVLDNVGQYLLQRNGPTLKPNEGIWSNHGQAAWMMLQCDLGQDCSGESLLMVRACAQGGRCGANDVYEMVRESWLTPDEYAKAIAMKEELLGALQAKDWVRLGFIPLPEKAKQKRSR